MCLAVLTPCSLPVARLHANSFVSHPAVCSPSVSAYRHTDDHQCRPPSASQRYAAPASGPLHDIGTFFRKATSSKPSAPPKPAKAPVKQVQDPRNTVFGSAHRRMQQPASAAQQASLLEVCEQCGARFANVMQLINHCDQVHAQSSGGPSRGPPAMQQGMRPEAYPCPSCSAVFPTAVQLVKHNESVHSKSDSSSCTVA